MIRIGTTSFSRSLLYNLQNTETEKVVFTFTDPPTANRGVVSPALIFNGTLLEVNFNPNVRVLTNVRTVVVQK